MTLPEVAPRKSGKRHLWYRAYAVVVLLAWNAVGFWAWGRDDREKYVLFLLPLLIPALFMLFNLMAFRFPYSVFGTRERTLPPPEPILESVSSTSGMIGLLNATWPFFSWDLYPSGLAFCVRFVGCGFIPLAAVEKVKKGFLGSCRVWHHSVEVRSPVLVSDGRVTDRLLELMPPASPLVTVAPR